MSTKKAQHGVYETPFYLIHCINAPSFKALSGTESVLWRSVVIVQTSMHQYD